MIKKEYEKCGSLHKRLKNSSNETGNILESAKIDETQQSKSFSETPRFLCLTTSPYDKGICILCQKPGVKLRRAALYETRKKCFVAKKLSDQDLLIRLYSVPNASDALANDVQYHMLGAVSKESCCKERRHYTSCS